MIVSIQDKTTEDIFCGKNSKAARAIPRELHRKAKMMLEILNAAASVQDMASPPGNRLHLLKDDLDGFWSVSVNDQFRIIFRFDGTSASDVLITDYH